MSENAVTNATTPDRVVVIEEEEAHSWDQYTQWCRTALGIHVSEALQIRDGTNTNSTSTNKEEEEERGVYTRRDIVAGECLLAVPWDSLLTVASPLHCTPGPQQARAQCLSRVLGRLTREDDALALRLLWSQHEDGPNSRWSRHLRVLPEAYPHAAVLGWTDQEVAELLTGSNVKLVVEQWRRQVREDYANLSQMNVTGEEDDDEGTTVKEYFTWFDFDNYQWALGSIWSRCCSVPKDGRVYKALGPYFDLFNHRSVDCHTQHGLATFGSSSQENEEDETRTTTTPITTTPSEQQQHYLTIVSGQAWSRDEQVYINYGPEDNGRLLALYGFGIPHNPHDKVHLWTALSPEAPYVEEKQKILSKFGVQNDEPFGLTLTDPLPSKLLGTLRIQRLNTLEELASLEAGGSLPLEQPIHPDNEALVLESLREALSTMYYGYSTSLEDDEQIIEAAAADNSNNNNNDDDEKNDHYQYHAFLAAQLRVGEKRILRSALEAVAVRQTTVE